MILYVLRLQVSNDDFKLVGRVTPFVHGSCPHLQETSLFLLLRETHIPTTIRLLPEHDETNERSNAGEKNMWHVINEYLSSVS
jgi:hypothetical protein